MKIVVACEMPEHALSDLKGLGSEVAYEPNPVAGELAGFIADASILVVSPNTPISAESLAHGGMLQMIVCAGAGAGQVAVDQASSQGVFVTHCPNKQMIACAELAIGLAIALDRNIVENTTTLRDGRWSRGEYLDARGFAQRTLGVIGPSAFCEALAPRVSGFGMSIIAWTPEGETPAGQRDTVEICNWPRELARRSDVVIAYLPISPDDSELIDAEFLESMDVGSSLIVVGELNTLPEDTLADAVRERGLRLALDVFPHEPTAGAGKLRSSLLQLPGVIGTHHVGAATEQARNAVAQEVVRIISSFLVTGEVLNPLNICERSPATWQLVMRLRDQVGVMAAVLDAIRADGINAEEITSRVFVGAKAAWCTISLDERPSTDALNAIRSLPDVLHLELRAVV